MGSGMVGVVGVGRVGQSLKEMESVGSEGSESGLGDCLRIGGGAVPALPVRSGQPRERTPRRCLAWRGQLKEC